MLAYCSVSCAKSGLNTTVPTSNIHQVQQLHTTSVNSVAFCGSTCRSSSWKLKCLQQFSVRWSLLQPLDVLHWRCKTMGGCQLCQSVASLPEQTASFFFLVNYSLYLLRLSLSRRETVKQEGEFECRMDLQGFQEKKALLGCGSSLHAHYPSQPDLESLHHKLFGLQPSDINLAWTS